MQVIVARTKRGQHVAHFQQNSNEAWFDDSVRTLIRIYGVLMFRLEEVSDLADSFSRFPLSVQRFVVGGPFRDCRPPDCR